MTANLTFLRYRGSGIGGMSITESFCGGCGASIVNACTAAERLCGECRKLDDQAIVVRMAQAAMTLARIRAAVPYDAPNADGDTCANCLELMENGEPDDGQEEHLICDACAQAIALEVRELLDAEVEK